MRRAALLLALGLLAARPAALAAPAPAPQASGPERSTRQLLQAGGLAIEEGDYRAAEARFREALDLDPRLAQAHFGLALVGLGQHDRRAAEKALRGALDSAPAAAEARYAVGVTSIAFGDARDAEIDLKAAADADKTFLEARYALGIVAAQRGDLKGAESALREALRLDPLHADAHFQLGAVLAKGGDLDGALAELSRALVKDPEIQEARPEDPLRFAARAIRPASASATLGLPLPVLRPALSWAKWRPGPGAAAAPAAIPDWYLYYEMALLLEDAGAWKGSVGMMEKALLLKDRSEGLATVADRLVDYSPHVHLATAYHQLGNFRDAFLHLGLAKNEGHASPEALQALTVLIQKDRLRPRIYLDSLPDHTPSESITIRGLILADEPVQRVEISGREALLRAATAQDIAKRLPDSDKAVVRESGQGVLFEVTGQKLAEGVNTIEVWPYFRNPARDGDLLEVQVVRVPAAPGPPASPPAAQPRPGAPKAAPRKPSATKPPAPGKVAP